MKTSSDPIGGGARMGRPLAAALLAAIFLTQSVLTWTWIDRNGFFDRPLTSDAAWYRIDALEMKHGFEAGGIFGWLEAGRAHARSHPPLLIMIAGLIASIRGDAGVSVEASVLAIQLFGLLHVLGAYRLARSFSGRGWSVAAAALSAFALGAIAHLRPFYPQFPMAALVLWALDAVVRSDGFEKRGASILAGLYIGIATLAKMLAPLYVFGAACAALVVALSRKEGRGRRLLNALAVILVAAGVAATWYAFHYKTVLGYADRVTGDEGQDFFSGALPVASIVRWLYYPWFFFESGIGWVMAPLFCAALVDVFARRRRAPTSTADGRAVAERSPVATRAWVLAAAPLVAYAPLTIGQTAGGGFYLGPFLPLAAIFMTRYAATRRSKAARIACAVWLACGALFYTALSQRYAGRPAEAISRAAPLTRDDAARIPGMEALPFSAESSEVRPLVFHIVPRVDSLFASFLGFVAGDGAAPAESWPTAEIIDVVARSPRTPPRVFVGNVFNRPHPYCGHAHLAYEARLKGVDAKVHSSEAQLRDASQAIGDAMGADFLVVDERPYPGMMTAEQILAALNPFGVEGELLFRRTPTAAGSIALVALRRTGEVDGPRPASDLDASDVRRVDVAFDNGWRVLGYRVRRGPSGAPFVVLWFDARAARESDVLTRVSCVPTSGKRSSVVVPTSRLRTTDDAPLVAATYAGFRWEADCPNAYFTIRTTTARADAPEGLAAAVRSDLRLRGRFSPSFMLVDEDEGASASRPETRERPK